MRTKVEFLAFPSCPNAQMLRSNLRAVLRRLRSDAEFDDINQQKLPQGDIRRGYPSPTILVNGRDLFGMPNPTQPTLGCRVYPGGLPSKDQIAECLKRAMSSGH